MTSQLKPAAAGALPRTARPEIAIVGMGYVGLPLAMVFAEAGKRVVGIDVDPDKVAQLRSGASYIEDIPSDDLKPMVDEGLLSATTRFGELAAADVVIIAVPTPLSDHREPDLSMVEAAAARIAPHLQSGQLVVLESTTYPGTTRDVVLPILSADGLQVGRDFYLAYSPERVDPGNATWNTRNTPKVVGGITEECTARARDLYASAIDTVHTVSTPEVAEMTKLLENIFRSVNIALVNELAMLCDRMGIDVWEVVGAAGTKPFGFMSFKPGPGLGGHCIPIDPFYLTWKAREYDFATEFIELAGKINSNMPYFCVQKIRRALNSQGKALKGSSVVLLGMSYKPDVGDTRESPAVKVLELLAAEGADVAFHDPHVHSVRACVGADGEMIPLPSEALDDDLIAEADVVAILTDHSNIDYAAIVEKARLVVDFRNVTGGLDSGKVWKL